MSPVDKKTIADKLENLNEVERILEILRGFSKKDFVADDIVNSAAMHNLTIGIEIITDIGNHILSGEFQSSAKTYKDIIIDLGKNGVIPQKFSEENEEMADFRNLLIHGYGRVDLDKVYNNLQKAPDIFRQFAKYYIDFLEKK